MPLREQLSSLADGCTDGIDWRQMLDAYAESVDMRQSWSAYHTMGDALRQPSQPPVAADPEFVSAVMARVRAEQPPQMAVAVPSVPNLHAAAANDGLFRWKMVAGLASVVAVVAVAWQMVAQPQAPAGPQWAGSSPALAGLQQVSGPDGQVMLRDAQLDELMAAHRQWGGMSALQVPAGFLRNATYEPSQR
jgi:sigma-E factor negative regulatory protein RseA